MNGLTASVSGDAPAGRTLIVGVSWIGDTVMSWPAVQAWRRLHPAHALTVLAKPAPATLWRLHPAPDEVWTLEPGARGVWRAARAARRARFQEAWVFPHSLRSALVPWLAGIPARIGMPGHFRDALLTRVVRPRGGPGRAHQQFEYLDLMGLGDEVPEVPRIRIPESARTAAAPWLAAGGGRPGIAIMPGAARGPSKRWPLDRFVELARRAAGEGGAYVLACGSSAEREACEAVAGAAGAQGRSLAGTAGMAEWAAALSACTLAVANDSGGMHLAASVGTPVVAIFGRTDPSVTGPLGRGHAVIQASGEKDRAISRKDDEARRRLETVSVDEVWTACRARL